MVYPMLGRLPVRWSEPVCSKIVRILTRLFATVAIIAVVAAPLGAQTNERSRAVREAMQQLKESRRYNFVLPNAKPVERAKRVKFRLPNWFGNWTLPTLLPTSLSPETRFIIYALVIVLLCLVLLPLLMRIRFGAAGKGEPKRGPVVAPDIDDEIELPKSLDEALAQAEAFAAKGDFANAVHRLWLGIVSELRERGVRNISPAETAREIVRSLRQRAELVSAVRPLARTVEVSRFGGRSVSGDDYKGSLDAFHQAATLIRASAAVASHVAGPAAESSPGGSSGAAVPTVVRQ